MATTLLHAFRWWERANPDRIALVLGDEELSYRQLGAWADRVAYALRTDYGVEPGDVVAVAGVNSVEWCVAVLGGLRAGATVTPFNYRFTAPELAYLVENSEPKVIVVDAVERLKVETATASRALNGGALMSTADVRSLETGDARSVEVEVTPSSPALLAYTSGTTGTPKGIVYTHETTLWALAELVLKDPTPPDETVALVALPLFSVGGIKHGLVHSVARGGKVVIMRDFDPVEALELITTHRVSHMNGVPLIYERIAALPDFERHDLSHMKFAQVGGARVHGELLAAWQQRGVALRHMYGMTEAGGCGTVPRADEALAHPELCGDGSIFTEIKVVRPDGTACDPGEEGEIVMRGPAVMAGYWKNPEGTAETIRDGWVHSGDIGTLDEAGRLKFVDRLKDVIVSGGFNVASTEVENIIATVPGVSEVAVIAVADTTWGEVPAAIVYSAGVVDTDALLDAARANLAVFKVPKYVEVVDKPLPRMPSGKIAKRQLREEYARLGDPVPS